MSERLSNWLVPLVRAVCSAPGAPAPTTTSADDADAWLTVELVQRGFDLGLPSDALAGLGDFEARIRYDRFVVLNTTAHRFQLGLAILRREGIPADLTADALLLFVALALQTGQAKLAKSAYELLDRRELDPDDKGADKRLSTLCKKLQDAVEDDALEANHPLLGHPFHQILLYHSALLYGRLMTCVAKARFQPGGRVEPDVVEALRGARMNAILPAISASIALTCADGVVDEEERRLIEALMRAARLESTQMGALRTEFSNPQTPAALAREILDPSLRRFVLRLVYLAAHINSHFTDSERVFVEQLAAEFGASAEALDRYEVEALAAYEAHGDLLDDLSKSALARRLRQNLSDRFEAAAKLNAGRLWSEIKETGDLAQLLVKAGSGPLTAEERQAARSQLKDICKAVPALAIFAVPGGSFLLPLLVKHMPFDILPSAFADKERLDGAPATVDLPVDEPG